jgi:acyl-CoA thioester hydrolase
MGPADHGAGSGTGAPWTDVYVRVRYAETDAQGVVYHANYLVYMEVARSALARAAGIPYGEMESRGVNLLVAGAELRFKAPARYDDPLVVRVKVRRVRGKFVTFEYRIEHRDSGRLLVVGTTTHVCTDSAFRPLDVPEWVSAAFDPTATRDREYRGDDVSTGLDETVPGA